MVRFGYACINTELREQGASLARRLARCVMQPRRVWKV